MHINVQATIKVKLIKLLVDHARKTYNQQVASGMDLTSLRKIDSRSLT